MKRKVLSLILLFMPFIFINAQDSSGKSLSSIENINFIGNGHYNLQKFTKDIDLKESIDILEFSDDLCALSLFAQKFIPFNFRLDLRLEDELPYENHKYVYSEFYYLDFNLNYTVGAFDFTFLIENLLGWFNTDVSITPELAKRSGVYNEVLFSYDSDFLVSAGITLNF